MLTFTLSTVEMWVGALFWPFVRILALFSAAPVLSHRAVPARAKVGIALVVAIVAAPAGEAQAIPLFSVHAPLMLVYQMLIGFAMGFAVRIAFAAAELAGEMIGFQMGLSFGTFIDPINSTQTPIVGTFTGLCATLMFLSMDGHLALLAAATTEYNLSPAATPNVAALLDWMRLASLGASLFSSALHIALPVVASMLIVNLAFGFMGRAAPQLNLYSVGFPLTLLAGLGLLAIMLPHMAVPLRAALQSSLNLF